MNTTEIINVMEELKSNEINCPYCSREPQKHEKTCVFVDFKVAEVLIEAYTNSLFTTNSLKTQVYSFIRDRSTRMYYLDAVCYALTDLIYKKTGITEDDMIYLTRRNSRFFYVWINIHVLMRNNSFFQNRNSPVENANVAICAFEVLYDIKSSYLGSYTTTLNIYSQRNVIFLFKTYITRWIKSR